MFYEFLSKNLYKIQPVNKGINETNFQKNRCRSTTFGISIAHDVSNKSCKDGLHKITKTFLRTFI